MKGGEDAFLPAITMEDDLGIVYLVENAQQFWSELEDILYIPSDKAPTLSLLDSTLKRFLRLCSVYHEQYLQSPLQLDHACGMLLESELFTFHSERMCEILLDDAQSTTDPHSQLVFYRTLLCYGRRRADFFRSQKRWQPLIPLLMDHVLVDIGPEVEDTYFGVGPVAQGSNAGAVTVPVPIEAKLRSLSVNLLYEVCRVQKLSIQELRIFDDSFIDYLFDLVEQTRNMQNESFNYSVIKLIVALNEQFMVASLHNPSNETPLLVPRKSEPPEDKNRVLLVLMRRLGHSMTFGENMIFMLNRAKRTPEDLCMQLLVLKILYLLFTTKGTSEYFYTNDLCVLVDVFLRELVDLDEDSESLRHTYLRVLHPLLTKTQLRSVPYKRPQIVFALESLMQNSGIRDINPTTKRLVERCLNGEWCVQLRKPHQQRQHSFDDSRVASPSHDSVASAAQAQHKASQPSTASVERSGSIGKTKGLKSSKSMEVLKGPNLTSQQRQPSRSAIEPPGTRRPSNASLPGVASATTTNASGTPLTSKRKNSPAASSHVTESFAVPAGRHGHVQSSSNSEAGVSPNFHQYHNHSQLHLPTLPLNASSLPSSPVTGGVSPIIHDPPKQRRAAPTPPKRRNPPAIPIGRTNGGTTITTIKSSVSGSTLPGRSAT